CQDNYRPASRPHSALIYRPIFGRAHGGRRPILEHVELTWLDPDHLDRRDVDGAVAVLEAARAVDASQRLGNTVTSFTAWLRHGWDGHPALQAVARRGRGRVVGVLELWLPRLDNTHLAVVGVTVDPLLRRQGIGRRLFEAGVQRVRAEGRRLVLADCLDDSPG